MATAKKQRRQTSARNIAATRKQDEPVPGVDEPMADADHEMIVVGDTDEAQANPAEGAVEIPTADGMISISLPGAAVPKKNDKFDANIALDLDDTNLGRISSMLLEAIDQDERGRSEWIEQRSSGLDLLGQKIEKPGTGNVGSSATAVAGQSTVRDSILSEACDQFQANAYAELCPASGPCKVVDYGTERDAHDSLANDLEKDFNFYLTGSGPGTAKEYYPDTRRMLWWTGYASGMFKKVYKCPLRRRPVSESVDGTDLIVPSNITDLANAGRITHQINMRQSTVKRMQLLGVYRDVTLTQPTPQPNALEQKEASVTGVRATPERVEDQDYTLYECYCELDIPGYEHKEKGEKEPSGLPLPYRVTIDKDSRQILEIRRNWREDDEDYIAKIPFVPFPYATGLGFYGTGLLQRLGNYSMALTAMLRECIDAGMFASFPGFLYAKPMGRQLQNEFRVPPGGGAPIDVSAVGGNIQNAVMPLPYKDVSTAMVALMGQTRENAFRYGGMANTGVAEGKQDAPVGTTLAMIEQATKIEGGVHKALHAAQAEELQLLKELFKEDPEALWRGNRRPALGPDEATRRARFAQALEDCELVPASDPNVPSKMHRMAKANAYLQQALLMPGVFNMQSVAKRWGSMIGIDGIEGDFLPPPPPGADPMAEMAKQKMAIDMAKVQTQQQALQMKQQSDHANRQSKEQIEAMKLAQKAHADQQNQIAGSQMQPDPLQHRALDLKEQQIGQGFVKIASDSHNARLDRESKESIEAMKIAQTVGVHPESNQIVDEQMQQMAPFLSPTKGKEAPAQGTKRGGRVEDKKQEYSEEDAHAIWLATEIAKALQEQPTSGYSH